MTGFGFRRVIQWVSVGGDRVDQEYVLNPGDTLTVVSKNESECLSTVLEGAHEHFANDLPKADCSTSGIRVTVNGREIVITGVAKPMFVDVLRYVELDLSRPQGKLKVLLNGRPAQYTDELGDGDAVLIGWE